MATIGSRSFSQCLIPLLGATVAACTPLAPPPASPPPRADPVPVAEPEPRKISLNLVDADVLQVLNAFSQLAEQPVVVDPQAQRVARCARLSIMTPVSVSPAAVAGLLQRALQPTGLRLEREGAGWIVRYDGSTPSDACPVSTPAAPPTHDPVSVPPEPQMTEPEFRAAVQKVSNTRYHIARSALDALLMNQASWMRSARIVPVSSDGKIDGLRIFGIRRDSALDALGLQNGDMLVSVMGLSVTSPDQALEAYANARNAAIIPVVVRRRGTNLTLEYHIVTP